MTPQEHQVLAHLEQHDHITPLEALGVYGIYRLGARIFNIKAHLAEVGDPRKVITTLVRDPSGKKQYARYSLSPRSVKAAGLRTRKSPEKDVRDAPMFPPLPIRGSRVGLGTCA